MKKLLITALLLGTTSAFAASPQSVSVPINGTVLNDCVVLGFTPATFDYTASGGASNIFAGGASFECNHLTVPTQTTVSGNITLTATVAGNPYNLSASFTVGAAATSVNENGGDNFAYSVTPAAAAGQWGAPSSPGTYTGNVTINITF